MSTKVIQLNEVYTCINNGLVAFHTEAGANHYVPVKEENESVYLLSTTEEDESKLETISSSMFHDYFKIENGVEIFESIIEIPADEVLQMQQILDIKEGASEEHGRDEIIKTYSTSFYTAFGNFGVDIKVCNGDTPYVDPVLFQIIEDETHGEAWAEIYPLDVCDELVGTYEFEHYEFENDDDENNVPITLRVVVKTVDEAGEK